MTTIDLRDLPESERNARVNEAVAIHCAGWKKKRQLEPSDDHPGIETLVWFDADGGWWLDEDGRYKEPPFAASADAVLPLLEKHRWSHFTSNQHGVRTNWVQISREILHNDPNVQPIEILYFNGNVPGFALAACIALLRASGVEIIQ